MPKRKASSSSRLTVSSVDAALDVLAAETFEKLRHLVNKFNEASGIQLSEDAVKSRWEEACKRHWVMKAMEDLCCGSRVDDSMGDLQRGDMHTDSRPLPSQLHQGPVARHKLSLAEESEWKKWTPKTGDLVLVELANEEIWPGKVRDAHDRAYSRLSNVSASSKAARLPEVAAFTPSGYTRKTMIRKSYARACLTLGSSPSNHVWCLSICALIRQSWRPVLS